MASDCIWYEAEELSYRRNVLNYSPGRNSYLDSQSDIRRAAILP